MSHAGRAALDRASRNRATIPREEAAMRIGVDLGGTKIEAIALDETG